MKLILVLFTVLISATEIAQISADGIGRVAFGTMMTEAELEKFNYQVAIHILLKNGYGTFGGGILIAPDVVLTAAHCVGKDVESVVLFMGRTDKTSSNAAGGIRVNRDRFVVHENYTDPEKYNVVNPMHYDIALILLPELVQLSSLVNTIPLASKTFDCENVKAKAWVSGHGGFGKTTLAQNLSATELKTMRYAPVQPFPWDECIKIYGGLSQHRTQLCTQIVPGKTGGICGGDSGGPYAFENPSDPSGKRILCGIVSMGSDCEVHPSGYISVPYFLDWICDKSGRKVGCFDDYE